MTAAIANKGFYYTPHIIKSIDDETIDKNFTTKKETSIDSTHFEPIIEGMHRVYTKGTASFLKVPGIEICGKTGTAENFTKIDGIKTQLTDHSIFVAFAPKEDPKIAIAVLVENGYYGARWAGRIASLMIEKYLKGEVSLKYMERLVLNKSLEDEYLKPYSGKPFKSINNEPKNRAHSFQLDWVVVMIYLALVLFGYFNILSASTDGAFNSYFDLSEPYGKQSVFIGLSLISIVLILSIDAKFYERFASIIYLLSLSCASRLFCLW